MNTKQMDYLKFWQEVQELIDDGTPLIESMKIVRERLQLSPMQKICDDIIARLLSGQPLSESLTHHRSTFRPDAVNFVSLGEKVGRLGLILKVMNKALKENVFLLPGERKPLTEKNMPRYWRMMGYFLDTGCPLVRTFRVMQDLCNTRLKRSFRHMIDDVMKGHTFSQSMSKSHEIFPSPVIEAVKTGEERGTLEQVCFQIADAIENNDLSRLLTTRGKINIHEEALIFEKLGNLLISGISFEQALAVVTDECADKSLANVFREIGALHDNKENIANVLARYEEIFPKSIQLLWQCGTKKDLGQACLRIAAILKLQELK